MYNTIKTFILFLLVRRIEGFLAIHPFYTRRLLIFIAIMLIKVVSWSFKNKITKKGIFLPLFHKFNANNNIFAVICLNIAV